jgi:hypothetical protein
MDQNISSAAQGLRNAMKGIGTDEAAIINITKDYSFVQRKVINLKTKEIFN